MPTKVLYQTSARATGGRDGQAESTDGTLNVKLTTPKELGGPGGEGSNPEQLFAAGYAACFLNAMKFIYTRGGGKFPADASVTATVGIGPNTEGSFGLEIALAISLPGFNEADAKALMEKGHHVCPYSNATRNNVNVQLSLA
ncbi:MAG TPA: organic hydroperoxide resistance protein [Candidatus Angelobacter sp.]|nr:organic hydroperoxide resistance protein [Candidatus Angelobacter sp.]